MEKLEIVHDEEERVTSSSLLLSVAGEAEGNGGDG